MKPWEEEWVPFDDGEIGTKRAGVSGALALFEWSEQEDDDREAKWARAKLAAQAPAMARLLLRFRESPDTEATFWAEEIERVLRAAGVIP